MSRTNCFGWGRMGSSSLQVSNLLLYFVSYFRDKNLEALCLYACFASRFHKTSFACVQEH